MLRELKLGGIKWIDAVGLNPDEKEVLIEKYKVHELDVEACREGNQKARIDNYPDYSFLILHFPKYDILKKIYILNEFNIFLGKDFLITFRDDTGSHIDKIFENYSNVKVNTRKKDIKVSTGYILYEITQAMLEKMFTVTRKITSDLKDLEGKIFDGDNNSSLVKDILIKKRNIILLKHMFKPQIMVIKQLEITVNKIYAGEIEVYFEDLEDKIEQIINEISILHEHIESIEDTFKSMIDIKTNFVIKVLTVFSAFMLPLTLITSFYGMNVDLPFVENIQFVFLLLILSSFIMVLIYIFLRQKGKF
ncbi:MAG: magnesium transporter CorA family protein [Candidatus Gracilibacteria bacterium]